MRCQVERSREAEEIRSAVQELRGEAALREAVASSVDEKASNATNYVVRCRKAEGRLQSEEVEPRPVPQNSTK